MSRPEIEAWFRQITEGKAHLLGAALSELENAEQQSSNPEFQRQVSMLAVENAGLILAVLRVIGWEVLSKPIYY